MKNTTKLVTLLFIPMIMVIMGCEKVNPANFGKIELGMKREKVESILGKSKDNTYRTDQYRIIIGYSKLSIVNSKILFINDKSIPDNIVLVGMLEMSIPFGWGDSSLEFDPKNQLFIHGYKIIMDDYSAFMLSSNNDGYFDGIDLTNYQVTGKLLAKDKSIQVSNILKL